MGFTSGGLPQDICLVNLETKEQVVFRVKPLCKSKKENSFAFFIKPGNYSILGYQYAKSTWYGAQIHKETVQKADGSAIILSIGEGTVNYVGTWDFKSNNVDFLNDKENLDKDMRDKFKKIDFSKAIVTLPK